MVLGRRDTARVEGAALKTLKYSDWAGAIDSAEHRLAESLCTIRALHFHRRGTALPPRSRFGEGRSEVFPTAPPALFLLLSSTPEKV